jgi:pimeloyl-[acyl-carrier protein] methyl ester esterase
VKRRSLILIAGWGHTTQALNPVASALYENYDVWVSSNHEIAERFCATRLHRSKAAKRNPCMFSYAKGIQTAMGGPEEKDKRPVVVGWSAGGIVALEVVCKNPQSSAGLVLIGTTPKFCSGDGYPWGVAPRNVRAMILEIKRDPRAVLDRFFQDVSWPTVESESCRNEKVIAACHIGIKRLVQGLEYLRRTDLRSQLKKLEIPILIIHGREDRIVPWQAGAWLNDSLPNSRIIIHEGVGHDIPERRPVVLASQIREFLEDHC